MHADTLNQLPWKRSFNQESCLLPLSAIFLVARLDSSPVALSEMPQVTTILEIP